MKPRGLFASFMILLGMLNIEKTLHPPAASGGIFFATEGDQISNLE